MAIFEYVCADCGHRFEKLVRNTTGDQPEVVCPECRSDRPQRVLSAFAVGRHESTPAAASSPLRIGGG